MLSAETKKKKENAKEMKRRNVIPDYDFVFNEVDKKKSGKNVNFFYKLMKLNTKSIVWTLVAYIGQWLPSWMLPIVTANIINIATDALVANAVTYEVWKNLIINTAVILALVVINSPMTVLRATIVSRIVRRTSAGIKCSVIRKLQSLSITYHKDLVTGKVQSKFLKDTDSVDALFSQILNGIIPNVVNAIVSVFIALYTSPLVSLIFVLIVPLNVGISLIFRKRIMSSYKLYRKNTENVSAKLATMLEMVAVTKAHGLENVEQKSFNQSMEKLTDSGQALDKTNAKFGSMMWVLNQTLNVLCLAFCSVMALLGYIKVGHIVLYQTLFTQISGHIYNLINVLPQIGSGFDALNSISEIMSVKEVEATIGKAKIPKVDGNIKFEHVYYRYPNTDQYVIKDFSLDVKQGECIAIVGPSGSGKSTIMNMVIGFLLPTEGTMTVDGKSITEFKLPEYRHHISVVPQNSILFSGTIRENITYGLSHYTKKQLNAVVEMANITEFIKDLPDGLDTQIGERGDKLSGGQKQRVTIARALIRDPKILILDEATSALDNISEYHVQQAISSSIKGRTTFIVAHRLSTIRNADRILVLDGGEVVESGTYDELMQKKGKFYELKQLNDLNSNTAEQALS